MNLRSTVTATVASVAVAAGLLLGAAAPAAAAPTLPEVATRVDVVKPPIVFPSCKSMVPYYVPSLWGVSLTLADRYGSTDAELISLIRLRPDATCVWKKPATTIGATVGYGTISEVAITTKDFAYLRDYYLSHGYTAIPWHAATMPGTAVDLVFVKSYPKGRGAEMAFLSPDGWWITTSDQGAGTAGSFLYEAVDRFLDLNPTRV